MVNLIKKFQTAQNIFSGGGKTGGKGGGNGAPAALEDGGKLC